MMISHRYIASGVCITRKQESIFRHFSTVSVVTIQVILGCALLAFPLMGWSAELCQSSHSAQLDKVLNFELSPVGFMPGGWKGGPPGTIFRENEVTHVGEWAIRIARNSGSPSQFSTLTNCVQMDFTGKTIELIGYLRTENVKGFAGLWLREDGAVPGIAFDNMARRSLHGTTDWTKYSIKLPDKLQGRSLYFGVLLVGTGTAWASDLHLLVDGKPIWNTTIRKFTKTVNDTDRQFDKGSGIVIKQLSPEQIDNLVTLGKVWGFLKYYDPTITSGKQQWDYDLFRVLPAILSAPSRPKANAVIVHWIDSLGPVPPCNPCTHLKHTDLQLQPDVGWINNSSRLGHVLSKELKWIYKNPGTSKQFYVSLTPGVGNPIFEHERSYSSIQFPDAGFQLLALYRFWNIIEYWYPNRNIIGENWDRVLARFIPRLALAKDRTSYQLQLMQLIAMIHDTHANLWSSLNVRPPVGSCHLPVRIRFIQNQAVVTSFMDGAQAKTSTLQIGDVITRLDGKSVSALIDEWSPYYADSNEAARLRDIALYMTRGACGKTTVGIHRHARKLRLIVKRVPSTMGDFAYGTHDLPGPAFRLLSPEVAYLKLSSAKASDAASYIKQAAGTKGLIIDIRNYPSDYIGFSLGSLLVSRVTPFVRFTAPDLSDPGAFYWHTELSLTPKKPHYDGKIVILVDAITQSAAEYVSMAFRAAPGAIVVGSTTAGADGNVSRFTLPGGLFAMISGIGVYYPNDKPTQRVGIVPNVIVKPSIADIRAGRDPVLEEAIRLILGPKVPTVQIEHMYQDQTTHPASN